MTRVLEFCQSPSNPFEKLVRQEQLLHCTSVHAHLNNSRVNVNVEVKKHHQTTQFVFRK